MLRSFVRLVFISVRSVGLAVLVGLTAASSHLTQVAAAGERSDPVTWSVSPADASGPDGRAWVELTLDPGQSATEHFVVQNFSPETVTFRITAADGYITDTGRFNMLPSDRESVASGTWISVDDSVTVAAGEKAVVSFTIDVPSNAEPGDHAAGIAASVLSRSAGSDAGTSVGVESRVGFRVMTRVTGLLSPSMSLEAVDSAYELSWNPFRAGAVTVAFDAMNSGNTRLMIDGTVDVGGTTAKIIGHEDPLQELLAGDRRRLSVEVEQVWPLFLLPVTVTAVPTMVAIDGTESTVAPVTVDTVVWAMPLPHLLLVVGAILIIVSLVWNRARARRKLAAMLDHAREEGRRLTQSSSGDA